MTRPFRFGIVAGQLGSAADWTAKARRAEALGYASLVVPDTVGRTPSPLPALAVAAAVTSRLRVGPYVLANDYRNPVLLARECATLDVLTAGRFELGLGAGRPNAGDDYRKLGLSLDPPGTRVDRLTEALSIVKRLLGGETVSFGGRYYQVESAEAFPRPIQQPRPPILVAAAAPRLLALAAREADIVAVAGRPDEPEASIKQKIEQLRQAAGERFEQLELNVNLMAVGQDIHPQALAYLGLTADQVRGSDSPFLLLGGLDEMCARLLTRRRTLGYSYVLVSEAFMESFAPVVAALAGQ
jgi:probable F420-dependent oxidoreductase